MQESLTVSHSVSQCLTGNGWLLKIMTEADRHAAAELLELTSSDSPYGALSGFTIDKKIGKGQFSVVYRARAVHDERTVALKKVQIFEMMDSKARLDCMKEIQLLQVNQTKLAFI